MVWFNGEFQCLTEKRKRQKEEEEEKQRRHIIHPRCYLGTPNEKAPIFPLGLLLLLLLVSHREALFAFERWVMRHPSFFLSLLGYSQEKPVSVGGGLPMREFTRRLSVTKNSGIPAALRRRSAPCFCFLFRGHGRERETRVKMMISTVSFTQGKRHRGGRIHASWLSLSLSAV